VGFRSLAAELLPTALLQPARDRPSAAVPRPEANDFAALTDKLGYLSKAELRLVREAYKFADEAHLGQFRASGQPYITHPIAVAGLVADWKLDVQAVMAALMHDAMEDCGVTKPELIERFGAPTAELVDGLTKLDKLHFSTREESQAESFRKMLLATPPVWKSAACRALFHTGGVAGGIVPQDAAGDGARRTRDPRQTGRPPSQHAHAVGDGPRKARPDRARDAGHLRADRAPAGAESDLS